MELQSSELRKAKLRDFVKAEFLGDQISGTKRLQSPKIGGTNVATESEKLTSSQLGDFCQKTGAGKRKLAHKKPKTPPRPPPIIAVWIVFIEIIRIN